VPEKPTVFLHIGAPKTGTTYLQGILLKNRAALREAGLLFPGDDGRSHYWASQDLRNVTVKHGYVEPRVAGAWTRLLDEIRDFDGRALIDHETLAAASAAQIDRALADLDFAEVHLIWTARDIARQLPAAWQERVKNRDSMTFGDFLADARAGALGTGAQRPVFWGMHGTPKILARWSRNLPAENVHVVTLPPPGADPSLLWRRFASVLDIDPDAFRTDIEGQNTSLTAAEAAVLRDLNEALADVDVPWTVYRAVVKHRLSNALGAAADRGSGRIDLPADAYEWVLDWSRRAVGQLQAAGYDVVGDLDELIPQDRPSGLDPDAVPADVRAQAAVRMLRALLEQLVVKYAEVDELAAQRQRPAAPQRGIKRGGDLARRALARRRER
jgi:hypothetical protein